MTISALPFQSRLRPSATSPRLRVGLLAGLLLVALWSTAPERAAAQDPSGAVQQLVDRGTAAGLDRAQLSEVVTRARQSGLNADATAELLRPTVELADAGLPARHVLNKTLEGLAKRVPAGRMSPVLQQLAGHTERAGQIVDAWAGRPEVAERVQGIETARGARGQDVPMNARAQLIVNAAQAQQQGVPADVVAQVLDAVPGAVKTSVPAQTVAAAVGILPDVPGARSGSASARQLVTAAVGAGYDAEALRQLPAALQSARRSSNRPPDVLAKGAAQAIARGTPAADVLQGLFQGSLPGAGPPSTAGSSGGSPPGQGKPPGQGDAPPGQDRPPPDNPGQGSPPETPPGQGGGG